LSARLAAAYGAKAAWLSVQGATLPVMAGSLAWAGHGARVQVARHAHRSVLAAAVLGDWDVEWVSGPIHPLLGIGLPPSPSAWPEPLEGRVCRLVVSPTYEGLTAELPAGPTVSLFVDAAHGGHFGRSPALPPHPLQEGAELVAHGLHKTEPVLTQSGILLGRELFPDVDRWWRLLSTSSPSYLLLAGLEAYAATREVGDGGWGAFSEWAHGLWAAAERRGHFVLQAAMEREGWAVDPAKFTVAGDGPEMAGRLRAAGFEPEAVGAGWVTCVLGPQGAYGRRAVLDLLAALGPPTNPPPPLPWPDAPHRAVSLAAAFHGPRRPVPLRKARDLVAADALTPYPPGIPLVMPGEILDPNVLDYVEDRLRLNGAVEGVERSEREWRVWVVDV